VCSATKHTKGRAGCPQPAIRKAVGTPRPALWTARVVTLRLWEGSVVDPRMALGQPDAA